MDISFITGNKHKFAEMAEYIPGLQQLDIDLPEIQSLDPEEVIKAKLEAARSLHKGMLLVDDTSLTATKMNGLPGALVKWFLDAVGPEGIYKIVSAFGDHEVEAKTVIGLAEPGGEIKFFSGVVKGTVVEPRGDKGYGFDPIFLPDGSDKTFGEIEIVERERFSMRVLAVEKLTEYLQSKSNT